MLCLQISGLRQFMDKSDEFRGVDLVFGGLPCQEFSVTGKMDPDDERSKLIMTFLNMVEF